MTKLGEYLTRKSVNRAAVSRRTRIHTTRLNELSNTDSARLTAEELYLIALAIDVDPGKLLEYVCEGVKLKPDDPTAADN